MRRVWFLATFCVACTGSVEEPKPREGARTPDPDAFLEAAEGLVAADAGAPSSPSLPLRPMAPPPPGELRPDAGLPPTDAPSADVVEFTVRAGTGRGPWNTFEAAVLVYVGQTLRVHNEDEQSHTLHTFGAPCDHGEPIPPSEYRDHPILMTYEPRGDRVETYDHEAGETAPFWIRALAPPDP